MNLLKRESFLSLMLFIFFEPAFLQQNRYVGYAFDFAKIILFLFVIVFCTTNIKKYSIVSVCLVCMHCLFVLSAVITHSDVTKALKELIYALIFVIMTEYYVRMDLLLFLQAISKVLTIILIVNFISICIFPDGLYNNSMFAGCWFLGYKNVVFPYVGLDLFSLLLQRGRIERGKYLFMTFAALLSGMSFFIMSNAMTSVISMLVVLSVLVFYTYSRKAKCRINSLAVYSNLIFSIFLLNGSLENICSKLPVINKHLGNLRLRMILWSRVFSSLKNSWIVGKGTYYDTEFASIMGQKWMVNCHNTFLQITFQGGIICLSLFVFVLIYSCHKVNENDKFSRVVFASALLPFLVTFQTEWFNRYYYFYILIILGVYANEWKFEREEYSTVIRFKLF